ncbi:MAG: hypothetical protein WBP82_09890 [Leuconostoc mesenteroides]
MTIEKLISEGYEEVTSKEDVSVIVDDFNMPFEYLDYVMFVKYNWQGRVDTVFGCPIMDKETNWHAIRADNQSLQLLIWNEELLIYNESEYIKETTKNLFP